MDCEVELVTVRLVSAHGRCFPRVLSATSPHKATKPIDCKDRNILKRRAGAYHQPSRTDKIDQSQNSRFTLTDTQIRVSIHLFG